MPTIASQNHIIIFFFVVCCFRFVLVCVFYIYLFIYLPSLTVMRLYSLFAIVRWFSVRMGLVRLIFNFYYNLILLFLLFSNYCRFHLHLFPFVRRFTCIFFRSICKIRWMVHWVYYVINESGKVSLTMLYAIFTVELVSEYNCVGPKFDRKPDFSKLVSVRRN